MRQYLRPWMRWMKPNLLRPASPARRRLTEAVLRLEDLEARSLPSATITVLNLNDAGTGSLRAALAQANNGDTINFGSNVRGTIVLTSGELALHTSVTIQGPGASLLSISGNLATRIFEADNGETSTISGLAIINGQAGSNFGGGVLVDAGAALTLSACTISNNSSNDSDGGGIFVSGGSLTLDSCTVSGNASSHQGGGVEGLYAGTAITIRNSTFMNNQAFYNGGGLYVLNVASATVSNSTFTGNVASTTAGGSGGGIVDFASTLTVTASTISGNHAASGVLGGQGGGIANLSSGSVTLTDTIVAGNFLDSAASDIAGAVTGASSYNLIGTGGAGGLVNGQNGNQVGISNPGLGTLANNGGPTLTIALLAGSPALRAGTLSGIPGTDQRGVGRGPAPSVGAFDPGATAVTLTVTNLSDSGIGALRFELGVAQAGDTVNFAAGVHGTISLTSGELPLHRNLTLQGPGAGVLTVSAGHSSRDFEVFAGATVTISGLTITDGTAISGGGGGVLVDQDGTLTLSACVIANNAIGTANNDLGGGLFANGGRLTLDGCTVSGNTTGFQGGGIAGFGNTTAITIRNSTVVNNRSDFNGGGLYLSAVSSVTLVSNSTFTGNVGGESGTGGDGGGAGGGLVAFYASPLTITASTVSGNRTTSGSFGGQGGGIYTDGTVTLNDTIVAGNLLNGNPSDIAGTAAGSSSYNLIGTGGAGGLVNGQNHNQVGASNPDLGTLAANGGITQTLALLANSPALDAGDPALANTPDQRGVLRTGGVNIGAYQASASNFLVAGYASPITAGAIGDFTVTARDAFNNPALGYRGTARYSSTDPSQSSELFPFPASANGVLNLAEMLLTAGVQSITFTDITNSSITGAQTGIVVTPAAASQFTVTTSAADPDVAGTPFDVTVTVQDAYGNTVPGYTGTVAFSSGDPYGAILPADYTFTAADAGVHTFAAGAILYTAGTWDVTATDTNSGITGAAYVNVVAAGLDHFAVTTSVDGSSTVAGSPFDVTVIAQDAFNNTVTGYQGTVTFSSQDPYGASLPADYTFQPSDMGMAFFPAGATLFTAGTWDVTATDTTGGQTGSDFVQVTPAAAVAFQVIAPASATSGTAFDVTVIAVDPFGNTDINYQGTVHFSTTDSDPGVVLPADYTFQPTDQGVVTFAAGVTLITPGDQILTVADTVSGISGSATITVGDTAPELLQSFGKGRGSTQEAGSATAVRAATLDLVFQEMGQVWTHRTTGVDSILDPVG